MLACRITGSTLAVFTTAHLRHRLLAPPSHALSIPTLSRLIMIAAWATVITTHSSFRWRGDTPTVSRMVSPTPGQSPSTLVAMDGMELKAAFRRTRTTRHVTIGLCQDLIYRRFSL